MFNVYAVVQLIAEVEGVGLSAIAMAAALGCTADTVGNTSDGNTSDSNTPQGSFKILKWSSISYHIRYIHAILNRIKTKPFSLSFPRKRTNTSLYRTAFGLSLPSFSLDGIWSTSQTWVGYWWQVLPFVYQLQAQRWKSKGWDLNAWIRLASSASTHCRNVCARRSVSTVWPLCC